MSFPSSTIKYYSSFESYDGNTYQWEIRERGFSGTATPLTPSTRSHCSTRWVTSGDDEFGPIIGSETSLSFFDNAFNDVFNDLFGSDSSLHKKYALAITQSGTVLWIGLMEPISSDVDEDGLTLISVSATCGLGRLENFDYTSNEDTGDPKTGRARLTTIIAELLSATEFGLDIYVACDMYPRKSSGSQLTYDNNPLYNVYADRLAFSVGQDGSSQNRPVAANHNESLKALCERFGLVVFQAEGAWHIYAEELFYGTATPGPTKFYRWKYDSTGAESGGSEPANREEFTHAITLTNETLARQRASIGQLPQYNAVTVEYNHDVSQPLLNTDFSPTSESGRRMMGRTGTEYWVTANANVSRRVSNFQLEDEYEWRIDAVPFDWVGETASTINTNIGNFKASQTTLSTYKNGDQFQQQIEFYIDSSTGRNTAFNQDTMVAMQIKLNSSPTEYYLKLDTSTSDDSRQGEWVTTADTWITIKVGPTSLDSWTSIAFLTGALPDDGTITVTIGPVVESIIYTDDTGPVSNADYVLWDNVDLKFVRADGTLNPVTTVVTNYLVGTEKDDYRGKVVRTVIGDGPQDDSRGSLTYSSDISDRTADWEKGPVGASASGDSIDDLLTRIILRSTNRPRRTHNTTYETLSQRISPMRTIRRSGSNYRAKEIAYDWVDSVVSGSWYKTQQTGFTDNLEFGVKSGTGSGSLLRGSGSVAGTFAGGLSTSLLSEQAVRITRTSSVIPQGIHATNPQIINVEEIVEPLLKAGDKIVIIAPDLSFYRVEVASDQAAGATSISIVDPDSTSDPKANFDFTRQVAYPANILFVEDKLLSIARSGEEGFAVTVLGQELGTVNESPGGSANYTDIDVTGWNATLRAGSSIEVQQTDGSYVTAQLWADAYRGSTNIQITLPGESDTQTSIPMDLTSGKKISPSGSVNRADFTVTADAITSYISTDGDLIATIDTEASSDTTAYTDTDISTTLKAGDAVYFHRAASGRVFKRTVATVGSPTVNDFTVTSAFGGDDVLAVGDYVFGGTLVGMRIDADGVDFVNTHIKSDNYDGTIDSAGAITANGTAGWAITKSGEAEFADLTVRGTLSTLDGTLTVNTNGLFTDGTNYELGPDGLDFQLPSGPSAATELRWLETLGSTSAGDITLGAWSASPIGRVIEADADTFRLYTNGTLNTATGDGIWADSARYHGDGIVFGGSASEIVGSSAGLYLKSTSGSTSFLWPGNPGNNGDVLTSNGSGGLTFSPASGVSSLNGLSDVNITSATTGDLLRYNGSSWVDYPDSNYAAASHTHAATDITSGTLASARLSGSYTGITGVGALSAGSITSGFGSIATANTISTTSKIYVGGSTYASDGIQLDYNAGNPRFYVGDGADSYFQFDGTTAKLNGGLVTNLASGSDIGIQGWSSDIIFSATDVDTVSWTTGTIKLADGTTYSSISSGNTGNMTALTYIYFDSASPTALATTTTAANAIGTGKILIAVAQKNTDTGATEAVFQAFGGRGGQLLNAASIAANSITANEIAANTITAAQIDAGTITATELASDSVTATKIDVTDLSAVNTSTGSLSVTGDLTMNSYAGSEWASAKITSAGDIYANDGYFESLTAASSGLTVYSSTAGPASGTLAYANGVFTVDGDDVISEGSIGNGLSYSSFTLTTDISATSGGGGAVSNGDLLTLTDKNGNTVLVKCEIV